MLERELPSFGEPLRDALHPEGTDPGEEACRSPCNGDVRYIAEVAVQASGARIRTRGRNCRSFPSKMARDLLRIGRHATAGGVDVGARPHAEVLAAGEGPNHAERRQIDADRA